MTRVSNALGVAICTLLLGILPSAVTAQPVRSARDKVAPDVMRALEDGSAQDLIVEFEDGAIRQWAQAAVTQRRLLHEDASIVGEKATRYRTLKQNVYDAAGIGAADVLRPYEHLSLAFVRVRGSQALNRLIARREVVALFRDGRKYPTLDSTSAALAGQPVAASFGFTGSGSTVLVIDSGVNYALPEFGACSAPGVPSACKVAWYSDLSGTATQLDNSGHGTNVSGIVVGVGPNARIAAANVFGSGSSTSDSLVLQAIDWGIANQAAYNIRAINMSLGDGSRNSSPCQSGNPYYSAVQNAWSAGIVTVASSGNEAYLNAMANPACTPGVVSVGAVYSANWGGLAWSNCTDSTTAADKATCFSNSASFLTMLAPGALITAGGLQYGGTSQASPFVAGAVAVLRSAFPSDTLSQTIARLTSTGAQVTDSRNGIVKPRLNLGQSVRPVNDLFANRSSLGGSSGSSAGTNVNATSEPGEPNHAGSVGGASIWWKWTAPAAGQVSLDTGGSGFISLLAVYTGTAVSSLTPVAASTNGNGGIYFQAQAGTEYEIAVDGSNGTSGSVALHWSLNTAASADLVLTLGASAGTVASGGQVTYTMTVQNNGPQAATDVTVVDTLPAGLTLLSAPSNCTAAGSTVTCKFATLANGGSAAADIVSLAASAGTFVNQASASSGVPDPVPSNNSRSASLTITAASAGPNDNDVPTLPQWASILLVLTLATAIYRRGQMSPGR